MRFWLRWHGRQWLEKAQMSTAWLMPRWLVYWCTIRLVSAATVGPHATTVVPELTAMDAIGRWEM